MMMMLWGAKGTAITKDGIWRDTGVSWFWGMYILTWNPATAASDIDCYGDAVRIGKADEDRNCISGQCAHSWLSRGESPAVCQSLL
jgi:hypothetical protein